MRAAERLCATPDGNLYDANRATHSLITEGFFLSREDSSLPDLYIRSIDWEDAENNDFCLVTQQEVQGTELRRPDGVLYVNGLPLVVLEFKSAVREEATLAEAHRQVTVRQPLTHTAEIAYDHKDKNRQESSGKEEEVLRFQALKLHRTTYSLIDVPRCH